MKVRELIEESRVSSMVNQELFDVTVDDWRDAVLEKYPDARFENDTEFDYQGDATYDNAYVGEDDMWVGDWSAHERDDLTDFDVSGIGNGIVK
jgi:hypothetical protein